MDDAPAMTEEHHLCVLIHGFWGNPSHLRIMAKFLQEKNTTENLHILIAKSNTGNHTYDGIEIGGERICQEIEDEIWRLNCAGKQIRRLSLVGYSLGGLVARYAIGLLYSKGLFDHIQPINFTTFVTPHLGVQAPLSGWPNKLWNIFAARTLLSSGRQLFMIDAFRDTGRPLLEILADPDSIFIKGLAKVQRRTLYTNIVNDLSAVYYTTGITKVDPFVNLERINIRYLEGYEDVILNPGKPVGAVGLEEQDSFSKRLSRGSLTTARRLPRLLTQISYMPIDVFVVIIKSFAHSMASNRRIRRHERNLASDYRVPLLLTRIQEVSAKAVEDVYSNLNSTETLASLALAKHEPIPEEPNCNANRQTKSAQLSDQSPDDITPNFPILSLSESQFKMIQTLDGLGWRRYPVHIHQATHSHAAIIVRIEKKSFDEGRIVLRHWVDEEFML